MLGGYCCELCFQFLLGFPTWTAMDSRYSLGGDTSVRLVFEVMIRRHFVVDVLTVLPGRLDYRDCLLNIEEDLMS